MLGIGRTALFGLAGSVVAAGMVTLPVGPAQADGAGVVLFDEPFTGSSTVVPMAVPTSSSGPNTACLTAATTYVSGTLNSSCGASEPAGSGALRLTPSETFVVGGAFYRVSIPTSNGLDVTFDSAQYNARDSSSPADGIGFMMAAVDPTNPVAPASFGPSGGQLGYVGNSFGDGLPHGYLGVGLDTFGTWGFSGLSQPAAGSCPIPNGFTTSQYDVYNHRQQVAVRGPGNQRVGYCLLSTTEAANRGWAPGDPRIDVPAGGTRASAKVPVEVAINPSGAAITTEGGLPVPAKSYAVRVTYIGGTVKTLTGALPSMSTSMADSSWLDNAGIPKQLAFGFVGSTGTATEFHEITNVKARTLLGSPPRLSLGVTDDVHGAVAGTTAPVQYTLTPALAADAPAETQPMTVSWVLPPGTTPTTSASGTGWTCGTTACTYPASATNPVAPGTSLPPVRLAVRNSGGTYGAKTLSAVAGSGDAAPGSGSDTVQFLQSTTATQINWSPPTAIVYGTPLSSTQLNATASLFGAPNNQVPGVITYTPALGSVPSAGVTQLQAQFTPDSSAYTGSTNSRSLTVSKAVPGISWSPTPLTYPATLGPDQLNATATVPGSFSYDHAAGATLAAGVTQLKATFTPTDTRDYNIVTRTMGVTVLKGTPSVSWPSHSMTYGTPLGDAQLDAHADIDGTWDFAGLRGSTLQPGAHTLTATFKPSDASYTNVSAQTTINVGVATPPLTWDDPAAITYGTRLDATQLNASTPVTGTYSYRLANGQPADLALLNAGEGQALTVTFHPEDTAHYGDASATVHLDVRKAVPDVSWSAPAPIAYGDPLGDAQLDATSAVAGRFAYTPAAGAVLHAGTQQLSVTFTPEDQANYRSVDASTTLTVAKATPQVSWQPTSLTYGERVGEDQLSASFGIDGTYFYGDQAGQILDAGEHQLTVAFVPTDTDDYLPVDAATATLTVAKADPLLQWEDPSAVSYGTPLGSSQQNATATQDAGGTFTYDPAPNTILGAGTHDLTVTFVPSSPNYKSAQKTVSLTITKATPTITWATPAPIVYGTPIGPDQFNASASTEGQLTYNVSAGDVLHAGTTTLTAHLEPNDSDDFTPADTAVDLQVTKAPQDLAFPDPGAHTYGDKPFDLTATGGHSGNPVAYSLVDGSTACSLSGATITITSSGPCVVQAAQAGTDDYAAATPVVHSLTVGTRTPTITWSPTVPSDGSAGGTQVYNATITPTEAADHGNIAYAVDGDPLKSLANLPTGPHTISATYTPAPEWNDRYTPASKTVTFEVVKVDQTITFPPVADVAYGVAPVALSATSSAGLPVSFTSQTPQVCSTTAPDENSASQVSIVGVGTCTVIASQNGDARHFAAPTVTRSFTVGKAAQAVSVAAITDHSWGDTAFKVVTAGGPSGNPVVLSTSTPRVCNISGPTVTLVGVGTCTLAANQAGDSRYLPANPVVVAFAVGYRALFAFDGTKPKQVGSTIPIKLDVLDGKGATLASAGITLHAIAVDNGLKSLSPGSSQPGDDFKLNGSDYQFNLDTSGLTPGPHLLWYTITGDPARHSVAFTLKT